MLGIIQQILSFTGLTRKSRAGLSSFNYWILIFVGITYCLFSFFLPTNAAIGNKINENQKQYGKETDSIDFSEKSRTFAGKKTYKFPLYDWDVEVLYRDGFSYSESARPKRVFVNKKMISEKEANIIADLLYPKKERGPYKKQIKNAKFISHFFEHGVISFEMKLDEKRKKHLGIIGIRAILYSNGDNFKNIRVNAYH